MAESQVEYNSEVCDNIDVSYVPSTNLNHVEWYHRVCLLGKNVSTRLVQPYNMYSALAINICTYMNTKVTRGHNLANL